MDPLGPLNYHHHRAVGFQYYQKSIHDPTASLAILDSHHYFRLRISDCAVTIPLYTLAPYPRTSLHLSSTRFLPVELGRPSQTRVTSRAFSGSKQVPLCRRLYLKIPSPLSLSASAPRSRSTIVQPASKWWSVHPMPVAINGYPIHGRRPAAAAQIAIMCQAARPSSGRGVDGVRRHGFPSERPRY